MVELKNDKTSILAEGGDPGFERYDFMQRALLTVIRLARKGEQETLDRALAELGEALTQDKDLAVLEQAMKMVKDAILQADVTRKAGPVEPLPHESPAAPVALESTPPEPFVEDIKGILTDLLQELEIDLGQTYLDTISKLREKIGRDRELTAVKSHRDEVVQIARIYGQQVFHERERAASFIADIIQRLAEVDSYLFDWGKHVQHKHDRDVSFNHHLGGEIDLIESSVRSAEKLDELKGAVLKKLNGITEAIKQKDQDDQEQMNRMKQNLDRVKQEFDSTRTELDKIQEENRSLMARVQYDCLTGALSRYAFEERLAEELKRYQRHKRHFSVILFDLDRFKNVNDTYGHLIGDKVLRKAVEIIMPMLRQTDLIGRWGGDEFIVLLPETEAEQGGQVAEKLRQSIEKTDFLVRRKKLPITITLGLTQVLEKETIAESLMARADEALYQAKKAGRNRVGVR